MAVVSSVPSAGRSFMNSGTLSNDDNCEARSFFGLAVLWKAVVATSQPACTLSKSVWTRTSGPASGSSLPRPLARLR